MVIIQLVVYHKKGIQHICAVDDVCMIKASSQECLSSALLSLTVVNIVRLGKQMGNVLCLI